GGAGGGWEGSRSGVSCGGWVPSSAGGVWGGGPLIAAFCVPRRTRLDVAGLYRKGGPYWYAAGFNPRALVALAAGVAPCVPGFLAAVDLAEVPAVWTELYHYAWFLSFGISFATYALLMAWQAPAPE